MVMMDRGVNARPLRRMEICTVVGVSYVANVTRLSSEN